MRVTIGPLAILLCCLSLGLASAQVATSSVAGQGDPVLARLRWTGAQGDAGSAVFSGFAQGNSVTGWLYILGAEIPVTATLDGMGNVTAQAIGTSGAPVGEFTGRMTDGRLTGTYAFDDRAGVLPAAVSGSGQWRVQGAAGFEYLTQ